MKVSVITLVLAIGFAAAAYIQFETINDLKYSIDMNRHAMAQAVLRRDDRQVQSDHDWHQRTLVKLRQANQLFGLELIASGVLLLVAAVVLGFWAKKRRAQRRKLVD